MNKMELTWKLEDLPVLSIYVALVALGLVAALLGAPEVIVGLVGCALVAGALWALDVEIRKLGDEFRAWRQSADGDVLKDSEFGEIDIGAEDSRGDDTHDNVRSWAEVLAALGDGIECSVIDEQQAYIIEGLIRDCFSIQLGIGPDITQEILRLLKSGSLKASSDCPDLCSGAIYFAMNHGFFSENNIEEIKGLAARGIPQLTLDIVKYIEAMHPGLVVTGFREGSVLDLESEDGDLSFVPTPECNGWAALSKNGKE